MRNIWYWQHWIGCFFSQSEPVTGNLTENSKTRTSSGLISTAIYIFLSTFTNQNPSLSLSQPSCELHRLVNFYQLCVLYISWILFGLFLCSNQLCVLLAAATFSWKYFLTTLELSSLFDQPSSKWSRASSLNSIKLWTASFTCAVRAKPTLPCGKTIFTK